MKCVVFRFLGRELALGENLSEEPSEGRGSAKNIYRVVTSR